MKFGSLGWDLSTPPPLRRGLREPTPSPFCPVALRGVEGLAIRDISKSGLRARREETKAGTKAKRTPQRASSASDAPAPGPATIATGPSWSRWPQSLGSQAQGRGLERRHPQGLVETEEWRAQRAGAAQTRTAAAEPCRTVEAWLWRPACRGGTERSQSQGFRFLACCCCPSAPVPGHGGWWPPAFACRRGVG